MEYSNSTAHASSLFFNLKLLKVDDMYKLSISVLESHNNLAPVYFNDYFTQISTIHSYHTRHRLLRYTSVWNTFNVFY